MEFMLCCDTILTAAEAPSPPVNTQLIDSENGRTFIRGPGDGGTQGHVARVRGAFVGDLTLLVVRLRPEGEVHGVDHKHPIQSLPSSKFQSCSKDRRNEDSS